MRLRVPIAIMAGLLAATMQVHAKEEQPYAKPAVPAPADTEAACALDAATVFERTAPSVVQVYSVAVNPFRVAGRLSVRSGTAFAISESLVATNFHVVVDAKAVVVAAGGRIIEAQVVGRDSLLDIAILAVPGGRGSLRPVEFAPDDELRVGQPVFVVGHPMSLDLTISAGIVSGLSRFMPITTSSWLSKYIQTDAPISSGNSGGPLLDARGRVVGMVTLRIRVPEAENIGFAIPAATLQEVIPELVKHGEVARPWHGLYGQMVTPEMLALLGFTPFDRPWITGFMVETVEPGSAADRAGIRGGRIPVRYGLREMIIGGDIIIAVNGMALTSIEVAHRAVQELEIGSTVTATLIREGEVIEVSATIEKRPMLPQDVGIYQPHSDAE